MKGCGKVQEIHVETNDVRILVGSQHRIIIDKLYGPTCVPNLIITWDGDDWNVRKANARLRSALRSCQKKDSPESGGRPAKQREQAQDNSQETDLQKTQHVSSSNKSRPDECSCNNEEFPEINGPQTKLSSSSRETEVTCSGDTCESKKDNTADINILAREINNLSYELMENYINNPTEKRKFQRFLDLTDKEKKQVKSEMLDAVEHEIDGEYYDVCPNCEKKEFCDCLVLSKNDFNDFLDELKEKLAKMREEIGK